MVGHEVPHGPHLLLEKLQGQQSAEQNQADAVHVAATKRL